MIRDQVSHPYETTSRIIVLHIKLQQLVKPYTFFHHIKHINNSQVINSGGTYTYTDILHHHTWLFLPHCHPSRTTFISQYNRKYRSSIWNGVPVMYTVTLITLKCHRYLKKYLKNITCRRTVLGASVNRNKVVQLYSFLYPLQCFVLWKMQPMNDS
jgi:hypothetical protein